MGKVRIATIWLDGCSGCHMSLLDIDEHLIDLADQVDLVYSPLVDVLEYPGEVDVVLVEGAVSTIEDQRKLKLIRERSELLVAFGDCAVTSNVPAMRNEFMISDIFSHVYEHTAECNRQVPTTGVPSLLKQVRPLHAFVHVDLFVPGCPPASETIHFLLTELLQGRIPDLSGRSRFGA